MAYFKTPWAPELHFYLLLAVDSFDTLMNVLLAVPSLRPVFGQYPNCILLAILNKEMALFPGTILSGRSIALHALKLYSIERLYKKFHRDEEDKSGRSAIPASSVSAQAAVDLLNRMFPEDDVKLEDSSRTHGQELRYWINCVIQLQVVKPDMVAKSEKREEDTPQRFSEATVLRLIETHQILRTAYVNFVRDVPGEVQERRLYALSQLEPDVKVDRSSRSADIALASSLPLSDREKHSIMQAVYGLCFAVEMKKISWDCRHCLPGIHHSEITDSIWGPYDTIWQLEAITAVYRYLERKILAPIRSATTDREVFWEYFGYQFTYESDAHDNDDFYELYFGALVVQLGLVTLISHYNLNPTPLSSWPTPDGTTLLLDEAKENGWIPVIAGHQLRPIIAPDIKTVRGRGSLNSHHAYRLDDQKIRRRVRGIYDDTFHLENYIPLLRIADERWNGFSYMEDHYPQHITDFEIDEYYWDDDEPSAFCWWAPFSYMRWKSTGDVNEEAVYADLCMWDDRRLELWGLRWPYEVRQEVGEEEEDVKCS
ncbi:hypothetical protein BJ508DRAFT_332259 [Ascobolus immersus RN42]|uniref:Uncharacterized protein n=1 Tax=Ascobolus immersus RN42 TaxID=1160509 RepID=A0A3N4HNA1_ASCIM|nr:hypothetical protein BJ508DRAFT_332259 [Ascobolus immersus RN42]